MTLDTYFIESINPTFTVRLHLKNVSVYLIFYYPNDGGYDYEDPDIMKIVEISADKLVWEYHWKENRMGIIRKRDSEENRSISNVPKIYFT